MRYTVFLLNVVLLLAALARSAGTEVRAPRPISELLVWDAMEKHHDARADENSWEVAFEVTNRDSRSHVIEAVQPSCGCTVPQLPADPWVLPPGATSTLKLKVDFTAKEGRLTKSVQVASDLGTQTLGLTISIPARAIDADPQRKANFVIAQQNRQAVFQGDCARCHAAPALGQKDAFLYAAACGPCHESPHRASIVPELALAKQPRDAAYWREIVTRGRPGTLMPAFAKSEGGPLDEEQVESLVAYLVRTFAAPPPPPER